LPAAIAVLDVGKTRSKLSVWSTDGILLHHRDRINAARVENGVAQLDAPGIGAWLVDALSEAAGIARIAAIVPVGHGAAAMLMDGEAPVCALDYEAAVPADVAADYEAERDPFAATLSPRLPNGLNLGAQLFWLERLCPEVWPRRGRALLWPQYWAFVLSGEAASEATSLGCHSDLWRPFDHRFSDLALRRGWAERLGPVTAAGASLGTIRGSVADATGLPRDCRVFCGLHDSNAALHAARGFAELAGQRFSVVSTGTWFICLASAGAGPAAYDPAEDMLANVDVDGRPTPTARFMGGRDYEAWMGEALGAAPALDLLPAAAVLPEWRTADPPLRATRAAMELARRADRALSLVAAAGPVLIEGRFADDPVFGAALARLRPTQPVYRSPLADGVAQGGLRLVLGDRLASPALAPIAPAQAEFTG
jgi:sugar (pentulose or hexulose) kinase